jgi:hypothetical protein
MVCLYTDKIRGSVSLISGWVEVFLVICPLWAALHNVWALYCLKKAGLTFKSCAMITNASANSRNSSQFLNTFILLLWYETGFRIAFN